MRTLENAVSGRAESLRDDLFNPPGSIVHVLNGAVLVWHEDRMRP